MTPSRAYFSLPGDETRSGAQDLRRGLRHSARSNRRGLRPRIKGSVALLRRMEASIVGCDDQLVHLRSVRAKCVRRTSSRFTTNSDWLETMLICITTAICSALSAFTS